MSLNFAKLSLLALAAFGLSAGCQPNQDISSAGGDKGRPRMSSGGLENLTAQPDSGVRMDPPSNIAPWPDAGAYPDASPVKMDDKCAAESAAAKQVPLDLLLVVDRSGSMAYRVSAGGRTKWELAQEALVAFVKDAKSAGMGVGLQYFPMVQPCAMDADCGGGFFGLNSCVEPRVCATNGVISSPMVSCSARATMCTGGVTCVPLGRCSETGAACINVNEACPGGSATNRCLVTPKTCRDGVTAMCRVADYERLAVPIGELPMSAPALTFSLMSTQSGGATPTDPAIAAAFNQLKARAMANPGRSPVVVLVTDGQPNSCDPMPIPLITQLIGAAKMGTPSIPTYTIGVFTPDEIMEGRLTLQEWSTAAGTGMPFVITPGDDLTQKLLEALNAIRGSALPCEYMIPMPASGQLDFNKVNVHVSGSGSGPMGLDIPYVGDASKCDPVRGGWHYDVDPATGTPTRVVMCEATCKKFKMDATANIELRFGCQTVVIQ